MLDLLPKGVIEKMLDENIAKFFDTYATAYGLSKSVLTSSSLMAPIATFVG